MCVNDLFQSRAGAVFIQYQQVAFGVDTKLSGIYKGVPGMIFFLQNATSPKTVSELST